MKVAVVCNSVLLKKSLELFLRDKLSDFASCDVVVSDRKFECDKPILVVSSQKDADIKKPFGRAKLMSMLDGYENDQKIKQEVLHPKAEVKKPEESLESDINEILREFTQKITEAIKARN